jgi:hypothetical protein
MVVVSGERTVKERWKKRDKCLPSFIGKKVRFDRTVLFYRKLREDDESDNGDNDDGNEVFRTPARKRDISDVRTVSGGRSRSKKWEHVVRWYWYLDAFISNRWNRDLPHLPVKDIGKFKIVIATLTIITIIFGTVKKASIKNLLSIKHDGNLRTHPPTP